MILCEARPKRIMIADDHMMVRRGLSFFLSVFPDLRVVAQAGTSAEAVDQCASTIPDVVLIDVGIRDVGGIKTMQLIHAACPQVSVIIIARMGSSEPLVRAALRNGAAAVLRKDMPLNHLVDMIRQVTSQPNQPEPLAR